jgi:FixJ family two-component response regulator
MNIHKNARLTLYRRVELVQRLIQGEPAARVAAALQISVRTVRTWWARYHAEGAAGLADRSSQPAASPRQTPAARTSVTRGARSKSINHCHPPEGPCLVTQFAR